jgi:hypothetical protein
MNLFESPRKAIYNIHVLFALVICLAHLFRSTLPVLTYRDNAGRNAGTVSR